MDYKLRVPDSVSELVRGLHPELKRKVRASLDHIMRDVHAGKSLQRELAGLFSYRVSRFRIIYRIENDSIIESIALGPREHIYEETFRLIRRNRE